jgi:hypothetical protein
MDVHLIQFIVDFARELCFLIMNDGDITQCAEYAV